MMKKTFLVVVSVSVLFSAKVFADAYEDCNNFMYALYEEREWNSSQISCYMDGDVAWATDPQSGTVTVFGEGNLNLSLYGDPSETGQWNLTFDPGSNITSISDINYSGSDDFIFNIPDTVTSLGGDSGYFNANINNLKGIVFGENSQLTEIPDNAFYQGDPIHIVLPESVTSIGYSAFPQGSSIFISGNPDNLGGNGVYDLINYPLFVSGEYADTCMVCSSVYSDNATTFYYTTNDGKILVGGMGPYGTLLSPHDMEYYMEMRDFYLNDPQLGWEDYAKEAFFSGYTVYEYDSLEEFMLASGFELPASTMQENQDPVDPIDPEDPDPNNNPDPDPNNNPDPDPNPNNDPEPDPELGDATDLRIPKRIYTVEEAAAVVKPDRNTFKLRFR